MSKIKNWEKMSRNKKERVFRLTGYAKYLCEFSDGLNHDGETHGGYFATSPDEALLMAIDGNDGETLADFEGDEDAPAPRVVNWHTIYEVIQ